MKIKDKILPETSEEVKQRVRDTANKLVMKQETLEEAAEKYVEINVAKNVAKLMYKEHFIEGAKWQQEFNDTSQVTRVEVIQHSEPYNGRAYTNYNAKEVEIQFQDRGKTLKIFLK